MPILKIYVRIYSATNEKFKNRQFLSNNILCNYRIQDINGKKRIWFHCASMGEFEQARPVIEKLKQSNPDIYIILTFFSDSGYDNLKDYKFADITAYLPLDFKKSVKKFIDVFEPDVAIFIRYEIWLNYLKALDKHKIPTYLLNASKPQSRFISLYYKYCYRMFSRIYVMNTADMEYFESILPSDKVEYLPDTRFDRIYDKMKDSIGSPIIDKAVFGNTKVLVCGSTWGEDEDIILNALKMHNKNLNNKNRLAAVIVPHEPHSEHIQYITDKWHNYILLSKFHEISSSDIAEIQSGDKIIIVDSIGKLLKLYANADIAYIGGAFGAGVHSVTEPAGYGLPLITGTDIRKSPDAAELRKLGALTQISGAKELALQLSKLVSDDKLYSISSLTAKNFVESRLGSSDAFIRSLSIIGEL